MEKYVLTANLVSALQQYLIKRPFDEVANLVLALQQQIAPQIPKDAQEQAKQQQPEQEQ